MIDMNDYFQDIASQIKTARKGKGLTQKQLGQRVGIPQSHISKIENGTVDLQLSSLIEISRALDLELTLVPRKAVPVVKNLTRQNNFTSTYKKSGATGFRIADKASRSAHNFTSASEDFRKNVETFQNAVETKFPRPAYLLENSDDEDEA